MQGEKIRKGTAVLIFLFFVTLHADQLNIVLGPATLRMNNVLAGVLFFFFFLQKKGILRVHKQLAFSLGILVSITVLSCLCSSVPERSLLFFGWLLFTLLFYLILPYLLLHHYTTEKILGLYFASFFVTGIFAVGQWLISLCGFPAPFAYQFIRGNLVRPNAFCYEPSFYALYMTPFVVFMQLKVLLIPEQDSQAKKRENRRLLFIHFLFLISTATSTLFAYLILMGTLLGFSIFSSWQTIFPALKRTVLRYFIYCGSLFACMFFIFPQVTAQFFFKFFIRDFQEHHSFFERIVGICNTWKLFLMHPWIGVGLGAIPSELNQAWAEGSKRFLFLFTESELVRTPEF